MDTNGIDGDYDEGGEGAVDVGTAWNVGIVDKITNIDVGGIEDKKAIDVDTRQKELHMCQSILDSGAGVSCWPKASMKDMLMKPKQKGIRFKVANGTELEHLGKKEIHFQPTAFQNDKAVREGMCNMEFHVTDSTKPLASALTVLKAGNRIVLSKEGSFIENEKTKEKITLKVKG
jgi:hypothetical protein